VDSKAEEDVALALLLLDADAPLETMELPREEEEGGGGCIVVVVVVDPARGWEEDREEALLDVPKGAGGGCW